MATGSPRGHGYRCGAVEGKAVVAVCKARPNVLSDAPNEMELSDRWRRRVWHTWRTSSKNQGRLNTATSGSLERLIRTSRLDGNERHDDRTRTANGGAQTTAGN